MTGQELIERGIRAFGRGKLGEAERCWRDALALDPDDTRARGYLEQLIGRLASGAAPETSSAPVPLPAPASSAGPGPAGDPRSSGPPGAVPLPGPAGRSPPWGDLGAERSAGRAPEASPSAPHTTLAAYPRAMLDLSTLAAEAAAGSASAPRPDDPFLAAAQAAERPGRARRTLSEFAPSPWDDGPRLGSVQVEDGAGLDLSSVEEQSGIRPLVPEQGPSRPGAPVAPGSEVEVWMVGARELFALGDFSGSLEMIEKILRVDPEHAEARTYLAQNEATLIAMYESKLGSRTAVPRLAIQPEEVMWLNLDHRAGFLLAQIDGAISYEDLFALSGLPRLDTARILAALQQEGVIRT